MRTELIRLLLLAQISKEIAAFRCLTTIKYIEFLKINDKRQIETLYAALPEEIAARKQKSA